MAATSRDERRLLRQRGAGSRNIANADFGLNVGSQGTREERQLMRQRGAGNRKVDNIDFGFSFPTPGTSRRSVRKTPQTARRNSGRKSQTPLRASREPSIARSIRRGSTEVDRTVSRQRSVFETPGITQSTQSDGRDSSKRRKLNTGAAEPVDGGFDGPRRSLVARSRILHEERLLSNTGVSDEPDIPESSTAITTDSIREPSNLDDKENDRADVEGKSVVPKRRKRKSIVQHIGRKKKRISTESTQEPTTILVEEENANVRSNLTPEASPAVEDNEMHDASNDEDPDVQEHLPVEDAPLANTIPQSNKRHKRKKSMLLTRTKRRPSGKAKRLSEHALPTPEPTQERQSAEIDEHENQSIDDQTQQSIEETEVEPDPAPWRPGQTMMKRKLAAQKRRARMSISTSPAPRDEPEQEGDETYVEEDHTPEPPTPAPKKKQRRKRSSTSTDGSGSSTRQRLRGSTFPILTHRMTNTDALPTITEEDENDKDSEQEQDPLSTIFIDRSVPNAVDVLAQISRETIETAISKLSTQQQQSKDVSRAELKHKQTTLLQFSQSLDQRLFSMSEAVEHRLNLDTRLRKIKREKAELQARWMEIRRQRDNLALKTDDIRRRNWEGERRSRIQNEISELASRTEVELHREKPPADGEVGLEFLLRDLGGLISCSGNGNRGGGGGVLEKVRRFNDGLEGLALRLEGRG